MRESPVRNITPVVMWLIITNVAVFAVDLIIGPTPAPQPGFEFPPPLEKMGAFTVRSAVFEGRLWEFLTFQFLHGSLGHLLMNMLGLYFFGPFMERWWGRRKFLLFYLLCGVGGAAFFTLLMEAGWLPGGRETPVVGASAGIYGILAGVALIAPQLRVMLLFPPIELSMRQLAIGILAIAAGSVIFRIGGNEGGEAGHLGGALAGFLLVNFPRIIGKAGLPGGRLPRQAYGPKVRPRTEIDLHAEDEIDAILGKVSREGIQSLTERERARLIEISERKRIHDTENHD